MTTHSGPVKVAELTANVSAHLDGGIDDWPANIQDGIYTALERQANRSRASFEIVQAVCGHDVDTGYYVHVIAVGVVLQ